MFTPQYPRRASGFTLVELLTVIAIIAILMGILFPVIGSAVENGKKVAAKNDELQIITAIKAYYTEYGRYPTDKTEDVTLTDSDQVILMKELRVPSGYTPTLNPRKIPFLDVPDAKNLTLPENKQKSGISSTGKFLDPWGNPYIISMDANYSNSVSFGSNQLYTDSGVALSAPDTGKGINSGVAVSSIGRDSTVGNKKDGTKTLKGSDDVVSWQ